MSVSSTTTTEETLNLLSTLNQDDYEAEVAFRTLDFSETVPFTVAGYEPSHVLFPTTIQRYLTGSRAEFLYTNQSDYDYLYEIGPGLVRDFREKQHDVPPGGFYWKATENPSFYTIEDANGRYLYSHIVQQKLAPLFLTGQEPHKKQQYNFEDTTKIRAAISYSNKDFVIGLRLAEWPKEILQEFPIPEAIEKLKNIPLFLIAKSFPGSPLAKLEWRISFSLVELEILLNLPYYQRKAFLHLKHALVKDVKEIPSYFLKTTFLAVSAYFEQEHPQTEWTTQVFFKELIDTVHRAINEKCLPNFFIHTQNLFQLTDITNIDCVENKIQNFIYLETLNSRGSEFSINLENRYTSDDEALLGCLAETYFQVIRLIYDMAEWKRGVKLTCEMMPHKFTDQIREPFQNLARINFYFEDLHISEYDFSAYITDLTLVDLKECKGTDACLKCCSRGYFSLSGHVAKSIDTINEHHKEVVDWLDRIATRIRREIKQNKTSLIITKEKKTMERKESLNQLLKNPGEALRDCHISQEEKLLRGWCLRKACWILFLVILGTIIWFFMYFSLG